jgi:hypothetical protein
MLTKATYYCEIFTLNKNNNMKKFFVQACFLAAFITGSFAAKAQTADEIIDKYLDAIGGKENWKKVTSLKMEGNVEVQGLEIPFTMQAVHGKGFRTDGEFQGNFFIDIVTPTQGWSQNPMAGKATLQPLAEDELKEKLDELDIQGPFLDYKEKGSTVEFLGKEEAEGNEYFKIKLTTKNKNETTYFFDTKTYLVYKQESIAKQQGQDIPVTVKSLDYQTVDGGLKIPFKMDQGMMILAAKKYTINAPVDEKIFSDK